MNKTFDPFDPDQWANNPGCEAFEIAIDMRARAALAPNAVAVLGAHLAACESCRGYAVSAGAQDAALAATGAPKSDWSGVQKKLHDGVKRYRRVPWTMAWSGAAGLGLVAAVSYLTQGKLPTLQSLAAAFGVFAALMIGPYLWNLRRTSKLLEQHDVVATYRGELERTLLIGKRMYWMQALLVILCVGQTVAALSPALNGDTGELRNVVMNLVIAVSVVASVLYQRRSAKRARRELAELN